MGAGYSGACLVLTLGEAEVGLGAGVLAGQLSETLSQTNKTNK